MTGTATKPSHNCGKRAAAGEAPIRVGVVGTGRIARQHIGSLRNIPGVTIWACDLSPASAEAACERFGLQNWYCDYERMLLEVKPRVVHVTTPVASHVRLAMAALDAGAHVFVEKPIARTREEWTRLRDHARDRGLWIIESHNYLFNRPMRRVRDLIAARAFGDVLHMDALICLNLDPADFPGTEVSGSHLPGPVNDFLPHLASLSYALLGSHQSVRTYWSHRAWNPEQPADDFRALVLAERGTANLAFSVHGQPDAFLVRVTGTSMSATTNLFEGTLRLDFRRGGPRPLTPFINELAAARAACAGAFTGLSRKLQGGRGVYDGLWELIRQSYDALRQEGPPPVSISQIDQVNRLVDDLNCREFAL